MEQRRVLICAEQSNRSTEKAKKISLTSALTRRKENEELSDKAASRIGWWELLFFLVKHETRSCHGSSCDVCGFLKILGAFWVIDPEGGTIIFIACLKEKQSSYGLFHTGLSNPPRFP